MTGQKRHLWPGEARQGEWSRARLGALNVSDEWTLEGTQSFLLVLQLASPVDYIRSFAIY